MKILTDKEQLREKLAEINESIIYTQGEVDYAYKRKHNKDTWGFLSFILDSYRVLDYIYKKKLVQLKLLKEYKQSISDRLLDKS